MSDFILPGTLLAATILVCATALRAWTAWLDLRRLEIGRSSPGAEGETGVRIELADVRERLRKLEAIADYVEL